MLNQKQNIKSAKSKDTERGFERKKDKHEKGLMNKSSVIEYFDVVLFVKQKQKETKRKKETKTRNQKKAKKKDKKEGRKKRKKKDRERACEKGGGQKRLRRNKGRHSKVHKKWPF